MKVLYLEKRGCDFINNSDIAKVSNVGNHRVGSYDYSILGKDGEKYVVEFGHGTKRAVRTTHKKNGTPLKHHIVEIVKEYCLHIDTTYEKDGMGLRNTTIETAVWAMNLDYTLENILKVVNMFSIEQYDKIEFVEK